MLTKRQEAFCLAYVKCGNATQAYLEAGYSKGASPKTVNEAASRLLKNSKVDARIKELRQPAVEKAKITLETHLEELESLRNKAATDQKWGAAIQAEIARGKAAGLYVEKTELTGKNGAPIQSVQMTQNEYREIAQKVANEV